jgi:hypothetical protein
MENVMSSKIAAFVTTALLAGEVVPEEDGVAPFLVFWAPSIVERSLCFAMCLSVVVFSPCRSFTSDFSDASTRLQGMLGTSAIASSFFCRLAHFTARFLTHLFAFHGRDKGQSSSLPCMSHSVLGLL